MLRRGERCWSAGVETRKEVLRQVLRRTLNFLAAFLAAALGAWLPSGADKGIPDPPVDDEAFFSGCKRGGRVGRTPPLDDGMDSLTPPPSKRRPPAPSRTTEFGRLNVVERPELFVSHMRYGTRSETH